MTIIEIKENKDNLNNEYIDLDDEIINYLKDNKNENENVNDLSKIYENKSKSIYILHYPHQKNIVVSYGPPPKFDDYHIKHECSTDYGSSGSPILLIDNQKLIGVHCGGFKDIKNKCNAGTLIINALIDFQKMNNNNNIIKEEKKIYDKNNKNNQFKEIKKINDDKEIKLKDTLKKYNDAYKKLIENKDNEDDYDEGIKYKIKFNKTLEEFINSFSLTFIIFILFWNFDIRNR